MIWHDLTIFHRAIEPLNDLLKATKATWNSPWPSDIAQERRGSNGLDGGHGADAGGVEEVATGTMSWNHQEVETLSASPTI